MRRIVKIAVRFLHTKTALCDRKDTQSRFAVNAARSIVCVGTVLKIVKTEDFKFQCRTQHCVCRDIELGVLDLGEKGFNAARGIMCVGTLDPTCDQLLLGRFNAARGIMCVGTIQSQRIRRRSGVSMPHAALCVSGHEINEVSVKHDPFQCRTRHYVCRDMDSDE